MNISNYIFIFILTISLNSNAQFSFFHGNLNGQCLSNFHKESGVCTNNIKSCLITNGTGAKTWNGTDYGPCQVVSCNSGYSNVSGSCVVACVTANPNNINIMSPICASVSSAVGWKMQGGTVVGKWQYDSSKYIVAASLSASAMTNGPRALNGTSTTFISVSSTDSQSGIAKHGILINNGQLSSHTAYMYCSNLTQGGLSAGSWYLPNIHEAVAMIPYSGQNTRIWSGSQNDNGWTAGSVGTGGSVFLENKINSSNKVMCYRVF